MICPKCGNAVPEEKSFVLFAVLISWRMSGFVLVKIGLIFDLVIFAIIATIPHHF